MAVWKKNPAGMKNWWAGLGGEIDKLVKTAEKGATKKRILGAVGSVEGAIAAAAPVLIAVLDLFRRNDIPAQDIEAAGRGGLDVRARAAALEEVEPEVIDQVRADLIERRVAEEGATAETGRKVPVALLVGGAAVLFLALRKR